MSRFGLKEALLAAGVSMASLGVGCGGEKDEVNDQVCEEEIFSPGEEMISNPDNALFTSQESIYDDFYEKIKFLPISKGKIYNEEWERISLQEGVKMYKNRFSSEFWLRQHFDSIISDDEYRIELHEYIVKSCKKYDVPEEVAMGVMATESGGDRNARSNSKPSARGVFQLVPNTAVAMGLKLEGKIKNQDEYQVDERYDVEKNVEAGVKYLRSLYNRFGDWSLALVAYSGGPTKLEDYVCQDYDLPCQETNYKKRDGDNYMALTPEGRFLYREMVSHGEINLVDMYSKEFKGHGTDHNFQYPFYIAKIGEQARNVLETGEVLDIPEEIRLKLNK